MRPVLRPGLRPLRRADRYLQLGLDPERAVLVEDADGAAAAVLAALDGSRDETAVVDHVTGRGIPRPQVLHMLRALRNCGALCDVDLPLRLRAETDERERDRLAPDVAAVALSAPTAERGREAWRRRRRSLVRVHGRGRVAEQVQAVLTASGVRADTGGVATAVAVLAPSAGEVDRQLAAQLVRADVPHVLARVRETTGIVGPFVVPGHSSCLRCTDLHRTDRDPSWPYLLAQLARDEVADRGGATGHPCPAALAAWVASYAALEVIAFLEGAQPHTLGGTVELSSRDRVPRRRSWSPHPACGCGWVERR